MRDMILEGGADCVLLHKKGLYVAGQVSSTVNFILYASTKFCDFVVLCHIARIIIIASVEIKRGVIKSVGADCFSWLYEDKCSSHFIMNLQMVFTSSFKCKNYQSLLKIITLYIYARQVRLKINSFALSWRRREINSINPWLAKIYISSKPFFWMMRNLYSVIMITFLLT